MSFRQRLSVLLALFAGLLASANAGAQTLTMNNDTRGVQWDPYHAADDNLHINQINKRDCIYNKPIQFNLLITGTSTLWNNANIEAWLGTGCDMFPSRYGASATCVQVGTGLVSQHVVLVNPVDLVQPLVGSDVTATGGTGGTGGTSGTGGTGGTLSTGGTLTTGGTSGTGGTLGTLANVSGAGGTGGSGGASGTDGMSGTGGVAGTDGAAGTGATDGVAGMGGVMGAAGMSSAGMSSAGMSSAGMSSAGMSSAGTENVAGTTSVSAGGTTSVGGTTGVGQTGTTGGTGGDTTGGTGGDTTGGTGGTGISTPSVCDGDPTLPAPVSRTIYFMVLADGNPPPGTTGSGWLFKWTYQFDLVGPQAPTGVTAGIGENALIVNWTEAANADPDLLQYQLICDPPPGQPSGGIIGAAGDSGDSSTTDQTPSDGECYSPNFAEGETISQDIINTFSCGIAQKTATNAQANHLNNYEQYTVAIAAQDNFKNYGTISNLSCATPQPVTDFYEAYRTAGGRGGGGFCSIIGAQRSNALVAFGAFAALGLAFRRRAHQRRNRKDA